ncbi:MAG TPA: large conductance mechanosensitive channel protein MscL [Thiobacillaceae bacterium]|nr:large conductance mechanosensitive channel protein MscL [Thiobacillaceae bacterium]
MSMMQEFKEFAMKGNVLDMAVGVVIGGAFGKIVNSLVSDVIMPPIGMLMGGVNFSQLYLNLGETAFETLEAAEKAGAPVIKYGIFINTVLDFLIIAWAIFMVVKGINRLKREAPPEPAAPAAPPEDVLLLREIRDALKK